ncbi:PRC-barrel domain-containing protein [Tropicimonas aquimaris]|uniref:PRC-barrel domain-containing protein n=1 Tax=Tropicimonas aquimaris TaxID=914152 RepID=A0ABW3INZ2_9RHOB
MLKSLRNLHGGPLYVGDRDGTFSDAFFRIEDGGLTHILVDIGGWISSDRVLVSSEFLSPPEDVQADAGWRVALDEQALDAAPRWGESDGGGGIDLLKWPPVIVGPFGSTVSPILMYEQVRALQERAETAPAPAAARPQMSRNLQRVSAWFGLPAFDASGELGKVHDLDFDPDSRRIVAVVLEADGALPTRGREIPYGALRHLGGEGTHLVFQDLGGRAADPAGTGESRPGRRA